MLECVRVNPFRLPDWRWLRAAGIYDRSQPSTTRRRDEPLGYKWIRDAVRFRDAYARSEHNTIARWELIESRPAIFWAYHLYTMGSPMRSAVEAYLLARQSDFEVGFRCGLAPEIVEAYEALFFNVREKLNHQEYILHCVIGPALQQNLSERTFDLLWKLYGYFCGPHFLAGLISKFPSPVWCQTPDAMSAAIQDDAISTLKLKAAIAAKTVNVNTQTQLALMDQFTQFVEVERTTESQGRAQDQMLGHIQALFAALPFKVGAPKTGVDIGPLDIYDQGGVELNLDETMRAAVGQTLPDEALLKRLAYPRTLQTDAEAEKLAEHTV